MLYLGKYIVYWNIWVFNDIAVLVPNVLPKTIIENINQLITSRKRSDLDDTQCVFVHHHHHHWIIRIRGSFPRTGLFLCVLYCHSFSSVLKLWRDDESGLVLKRPLANKRLSNRQQNHFFWVCYNRTTDPEGASDDNGFECQFEYRPNMKLPRVSIEEMSAEKILNGIVARMM